MKLRANRCFAELNVGELKQTVFEAFGSIHVIPGPLKVQARQGVSSSRQSSASKDSLKIEKHC